MLQNSYIHSTITTAASVLWFIHTINGLDE